MHDRSLQAEGRSGQGASGKADIRAFPDCREFRHFGVIGRFGDKVPAVFQGGNRSRTIGGDPEPPYPIQAANGGLQAEADEPGPCDVGPDLAKITHTLTARATNHCAISSAMSRHSTKPALRKPSANFSASAGYRAESVSTSFSLNFRAPSSTTTLSTYLPAAKMVISPSWLDARQVGDQILGDAVGEVALAFIV